MYIRQLKLELNILICNHIFVFFDHEADFLPDGIPRYKILKIKEPNSKLVEKLEVIFFANREVFFWT